MRFGVISDLHVDLNGPPEGPRAVVQTLARAVRHARLEALLVAGDVSNRWDLSLESLRRLQADIDCPCLFVPGNHDLWNDALVQPARPLGEAWKAWDSYEALKAFSGNLCRGPLSLHGGFTVIGEPGWYDYAFGHPRYSLEDFERMRFEERLWSDKVNALWDRGTREMHALFRDRLERQLRAAATRAAAGGGTASRTILVTHAVSHRAFTVRRPSPMWEYLNAFLGSPEYGELAVRHGAALAVCGHVHHREETREGGTRFVCSCLGYSSEWDDPQDLEGEIGRSLTVLEL